MGEFQGDDAAQEVRPGRGAGSDSDAVEAIPEHNGGDQGGEGDALSHAGGEVAAACARITSVGRP
ncbi:hypothetical protein ACWD6R_26260 [Streptomyces sp. NPDC005151]